MKALSLRQPMAWAIFHGKDIENRTWKLPAYGFSPPDRIYIHASKEFDMEHWRWIADNDNRLCTFIPDYDSPVFVRGALIGEVDIVDCVRNHSSHWFFGPYGFVLRNPIEYKIPIPCKGKLGFFTPEVK